MPITKPRLQSVESREQAAKIVADRVADLLSAAIAETGRASLFVSGGSTPIAMFQRLSEKDLDWSSVNIALVDERFVPDTHQASNAKLVKDNLLQGEAAKANFAPMVSGDDIAGSVARASEVYEVILPPTCLILGLGSDGHTASWYPGASNLSDAFETVDRSVVAIDAAGCPVAGEVTDRLTLTRAAVAASKVAILLLHGDEKKHVFEEAFSKRTEDAPILAAVEDLGDRLETIWAP